jgi:hypothetical protein
MEQIPPTVVLCCTECQQHIPIFLTCESLYLHPYQPASLPYHEPHKLNPHYHTVRGGELYPVSSQPKKDYPAFCNRLLSYACCMALNAGLNMRHV